MEIVSGFSKMSKIQKIQWLTSQLPTLKNQELDIFQQFWNSSEKIQKSFDEFSENTISNYYLPFGLAPNFLINGKHYAVPMVIEESSVVAAASLAAKFWLTRGGFKTKIEGVTKVGHVHFLWKGSKDSLVDFFKVHQHTFLNSLSPLDENMRKRGGGIQSLELIDRTSELAFYYQLEVKARTCDAMGANFINSILEELSRLFKEQLDKVNLSQDYELIMSILSNYTPDCVIEASVSAPISSFESQEFLHKFITAVNIANVSVERAVTHNKGIMNGIDAVVVATGNDFRAVEACAHAFAARDGRYRSLSVAYIEDQQFHFKLKLPLNLGTTGGLTTLHPLSKISLEILGNPKAEELMGIVASVGLAQNFAAVKSLVTTGIQKGHMKLHLLNILTQFEATEDEREAAKKYFSDKVVSFQSVRSFIENVRVKH